MGKKSFARKIKKADPSPTGREIILSPMLPKSEVPKKRKNKISPSSDRDPKKQKPSAYTVKCRPLGLCQLVESLNEDQRSAIREIGFEGLLSMHDFRYMPWSSMTWFFENFNPKSRVLTFPNKKTIIVTPDDIRDLFLIPRNEGNDVLLNEGNDEQFTALVEFKGRYGITTKELTQSTVVSLLKGNRLRDGGDDFKRFFILYSLSTFLAATMNQTIDTSIFRSLVNITEIPQFDWCKFVVERLCKGLGGLKKNLNGCVLVLPLLYFHRFMWLGVAESSSLPLIKHWTCTKIKSRLKDELNVGQFGHGSWVEGVYPVSRHHNKPIPNHVPDKAEEDDVPSTSDGKEQHFITYKLPPGEKTDEEIRNVAKDGLQESFLLLQRDLSVITQIHLERVKQIRKKEERKQATSSSLPSSSLVADDDDELLCDPEFHKHIDDLVLQFKNFKKAPKETADVDNEKGNEKEKDDVEDIALSNFIPPFDLLTHTPTQTPIDYEKGKEKVKDDVQNDKKNEKGTTYECNDLTQLQTRRYELNIALG